MNTKAASDKSFPWIGKIKTKFGIPKQGSFTDISVFAVIHVYL